MPRWSIAGLPRPHCEPLCCHRSFPGGPLCCPRAWSVSPAAPRARQSSCIDSPSDRFGWTSAHRFRLHWEGLMAICVTIPGRGAPSPPSRNPRTLGSGDSRDRPAPAAHRANGSSEVKAGKYWTKATMTEGRTEATFPCAHCPSSWGRDGGVVVLSPRVHAQPLQPLTAVLCISLKAECPVHLPDTTPRAGQGPGGTRGASRHVSSPQADPRVGATVHTPDPACEPLCTRGSRP